MVVIRLARGGAKKRPFFNVVVADKREPRDGRFIEQVGYFNPNARGQETRLELNNERITHWLSQGAQPSERVQTLHKEFEKQAGNAAEPRQTMAEYKASQQSHAEAAHKAAAKKAEEEAKAAAAEEANTKAAEASAEAEDKPAEQ